MNVCECVRVSVWACVRAGSCERMCVRCTQSPSRAAFLETASIILLSVGEAGPSGLGARARSPCGFF